MPAQRARKMPFMLAALLGGVAVSGANAASTTVVCPMMNEPYSSHTVLFDLLIDPNARAVLEKSMPGLARVMPGAKPGAAPQSPSITAILTPEYMLRFQPKGSEEAMAALDAALKQVPLTAEARRARCARYDIVPPVLPKQIAHPAVLVFEKITGFRDGPSVDAAHAALSAIAARRGWTLVFSDNGAVMNRRDLARFDAVVWNNNSGDVLTLPQRAAFQRYIERGGGFAGMHGAGGDFYYHWAWYPDTLLGARFIGHPMQPQFQDAHVTVEDRADPIVAGLGAGWNMTEEWYSFAVSARKSGSHVLATLDESTYKQIGAAGESLSMGDHPIAWTRCVGKGRSFYSAIGHRPESYTEPHSVALLEQGVAWALGLGDQRCGKARLKP
jgi:type 1 glutamine amidotransferase